MENPSPQQLLFKIRFSNEILHHSKSPRSKPHYILKNRSKILCQKPKLDQSSIEKQHSDELSTNNGKALNWKKWSLNNEKYRLYCSWKKSKEK